MHPTAERQKTTDKYMREIKDKRAKEKAADLLAEAKALAAAKAVDPEFIRKERS